MQEVKGNIWDFQRKGRWVVVTTNGDVKKNGEAVMGRGIALQAKKKFPRLAEQLGLQLKNNGNHIYLFPEYRVITFPTKDHWWLEANLDLIEMAAVELSMLNLREDVYLPHVGCANGNRNWQQEIKPILEKWLLGPTYIAMEYDK